MSAVVSTRALCHSTPCQPRRILTLQSHLGMLWLTQNLPKFAIVWVYIITANGSLMDFSLSAKTALVTGSYRGTGLAIAQTLLTEGAKVLIHGLTTEQANSAVEELGGGVPVVGDISTAEGCAALVTDCAAHNIQIHGWTVTMKIGTALSPKTCCQRNVLPKPYYQICSLRLGHALSTLAPLVLPDRIQECLLITHQRVRWRL